MKRILTYRLLALICTVLLPILLPTEALAQRKLVPVKCNAEEREYGWVCLDSLFVEEGTLPPDTCARVFESRGGEFRINLRLLFTNSDFHVSFTGQDAYAAEFNELSKTRGVIDSSNAYLLDEQVRSFLGLLKDEVGFDQVVARGIAPGLSMSGPYTFRCDVPRPQHYNYWNVMQLWGQLQGADTTDERCVSEAQIRIDRGLHLPMPCALLLSVDSSSQLLSDNAPIVNHGAIQLSGIQGRYTVYDISGRIVTQGELMHGNESRVLQVNPGVYVLQSGTNVRTIMVMP